MTSKALVGATLIDGTGGDPVTGQAVVITDDRFSWIGPVADLDPAIEQVDLAGQYLLPGLLDANVHLLVCTEPAVLAPYAPGEYDDLVLEAAQVALRGGVTTVFDTWGPAASLRRVRDAINAGEQVGARVFFGGNIVGMGGPWTDDFHPPQEELDPAYAEQVNAVWEQGVGQELLLLPSEEVGPRITDYLARTGADFIKYSSSSHGHRHLIALSPDSQKAVVDAAHAAGVVVQACTISPEALKLALNAGCDLIQHADITGPHPIPAATLQAMVERQVPTTAFFETDAHFAAAPMEFLGEQIKQMMLTKEQNDRDLVNAGAKVLLAHDMGIYPPTSMTGMVMANVPDHPGNLGSSHVYWFQAAVEKGMQPMAALLAATRNIAEAYGKLDDLGTIEVGKRADCLVLDADPLADPGNYRRISHVFKDGVTVDRAALPSKQLLTVDMELPAL